MKFVSFILGPLLLLITPKYDALFSHGYDDAILYLKENATSINTILTDRNSEKEVMLSVVFPEVVRYSFLIDFFQESTNSIIYINYGKEKADFSIGRFQMKPSFIEKIENFIESNPSLTKQYSMVYQYSQTNPKDIRKERLDRLSDINWQLYYLKCFYSIMHYRFGDSCWENNADKIRFYASAYNHDFITSKEDIEKWTTINSFPYGTGYPDKTQYSYSKIAVYFYNHHWDIVSKSLEKAIKK